MSYKRRSNPGDCQGAATAEVRQPSVVQANCARTPCRHARTGRTLVSALSDATVGITLMAKALRAQYDSNHGCWCRPNQNLFPHCRVRWQPFSTNERTPQMATGSRTTYSGKVSGLALDTSGVEPAPRSVKTGAVTQTCGSSGTRVDVRKILGCAVRGGHIRGVTTRFLIEKSRLSHGQSVYGLQLKPPNVLT